MAMSNLKNRNGVTEELLSKLTLLRQVVGKSDDVICDELGLDPFEFQVLCKQHSIHKKSGPAFSPTGRLWREIQWRVERAGSERKQVKVLAQINNFLKRQSKRTT
jgi:hypothetical protein